MMSEVLDSSLVLHWYVKIIEITNNNNNCYYYLIMFSSFILIPDPFSTGTMPYIRGTSETIVPILQPYNGCMHCIQTDDHFRQLLTKFKGQRQTRGQTGYSMQVVATQPGHLHW